ncbi:hypothetical protein MOQ_002305 [Trypanosoma cruzi marinkellei]|uniref:Uncharacterized protein n=1 Tax=Trypanosoma cruzi marinkellei TaxID=85056 RepID=K2N9D8_TRYCR|nr:hypothetical protein MOQ_002305 [Trypanosoma cruzi marinkellei]
MKANAPMLSRYQKVKCLIKLWTARETRHPKSYPPLPTNARVLTPNNYGRAQTHPTTAPLRTGAGPRWNTWRGAAPSTLCGKACRTREFNRRLRTVVTVFAESAKWGYHTPSLQSGENRHFQPPRPPPPPHTDAVTLASRLSRLMENIPAARIRGVIDSQLTPRRPGCWPDNSALDQLLHLRAAMHSNTPRQRTPAEIADRADAFDAVGHDKIILEVRRLSFCNHIVRWPAVFLNN